MNKIKYGVIIAIFCLFCSRLFAQQAFLFESLNVPGGTSTATVGTSIIQGEAMDGYTSWKALYTVEGGSIRFRYDYGTTTISTTVGHKAVDGDVIVLDRLSDIRNFRTVQTGSVSTFVHVTYSRESVKK